MGMRDWMIGVWLVCFAGTGLGTAEHLESALQSITTNDLLRHIRVLASDEFEGRAPGSAGEEKTIKYLVEQFKALGLTPGHPDGTYLQNVPLAGFTSEPTITFTAAGKALDVAWPKD